MAVWVLEVGCWIFLGVFWGMEEWNRMTDNLVFLARGDGKSGWDAARCCVLCSTWEEGGRRYSEVWFNEVAFPVKSFVGKLLEA